MMMLTQLYQIEGYGMGQKKNQSMLIAAIAAGVAGGMVVNAFAAFDPFQPTRGTTTTVVGPARPGATAVATSPFMGPVRPALGPVAPSDSGDGNGSGALNIIPPSGGTETPSGPIAPQRPPTRDPFRPPIRSPFTP
jgi:hypothetical protein